MHFNKFLTCLISFKIQFHIVCIVEIFRHFTPQDDKQQRIIIYYRRLSF